MLKVLLTEQGWIRCQAWFHDSALKRGLSRAGWNENTGSAAGGSCGPPWADAAAAPSAGGGGVRAACGARAGGVAGAGGRRHHAPPAVLSRVHSAAWLKVKPSPKSAAKEAWLQQDEAPDGSPRRDAVAQEAVRFVQPVFHLWERRGPGTQGLMRAMPVLSCRALPPHGRALLPDGPMHTATPFPLFLTTGCFVTGCLSVRRSGELYGDFQKWLEERIPAPVTYSRRRGWFRPTCGGGGG